MTQPMPIPALKSLLSPQGAWCVPRSLSLGTCCSLCLAWFPLPDFLVPLSSHPSLGWGLSGHFDHVPSHYTTSHLAGTQM